MNRALRAQFRVHTLLALMVVACVVLATWRESTAALSFVLVVIACVTSILVLRRRPYPTGMQIIYGTLLGLIIGMLFATTRDAHNRREELALLGAAAMGGGVGGVISAGRMQTKPESHPLDDPLGEIDSEHDLGENDVAD